MSLEENKALVRRFYDQVWSRGNVDVASDVFAEDFVRHDLRPGTAAPGPAGQAQIATDFRAAFPDLRMEVDLIFGEGDLVAARWTSEGTNSGTWAGRPPTGRRARFSGVNIFRFRGGKVVELWNHRDDLGLIQQIGAEIYAGAAPVAPAMTQTGENRTLTCFSLIHGSAQNSEVWALLTPELRRRGHDVVTVDLPRDAPESAERYAEFVAQSLAGVDEEVIVVAHSASGLILPSVAEFRPPRRLVFLAGAIPRIGTSFLDQFQAERDVMFNPEWIGQDPFNNEQAAFRFLFHDCEPDVASWALTTRTSWYPDGLYSEVCPLKSWPDVPSSYIVCTDDRTIRPEWARRAARALLGVEAIALPGGHCPQVSRPKRLAEVLSALVAL